MDIASTGTSGIRLRSVLRNHLRNYESMLTPRVIDFAPPEPEPPKYIEPGTYKVDIVGVEEGRSKTRGWHYYRWELEPHIHPEFRVWYVTLTEKHLDALADLIEAAIGMRPVGKLVFQPNELLEKTITVKLGLAKLHSTFSSTVRKVIH